MSGIAGSGKSTWANKYAQTHENTVVISTDALRYELFGAYVLPRDQEKIVQKTIIERIEKAAKEHLNVVLDIAVVINKNRLKWYNRLRQYYPEVELVFFDIPLEVCLENNTKRDRHVPNYVIKQMDSMKQQPDEELKKLFKSITIFKNYNY